MGRGKGRFCKGGLLLICTVLSLFYLQLGWGLLNKYKENEGKTGQRRREGEGRVHVWRSAPAAALARAGKGTRPSAGCRAELCGVRKDEIWSQSVRGGSTLKPSFQTGGSCASSTSPCTLSSASSPRSAGFPRQPACRGWRWSPAPLPCLGLLSPDPCGSGALSPEARQACVRATQVVPTCVSPLPAEGDQSPVGRGWQKGLGAGRWRGARVWKAQTLPGKKPEGFHGHLGHFPSHGTSLATRQSAAFMASCTREQQPGPVLLTSLMVGWRVLSS